MLSAILVLPVAVICAMLLSAFLRRLAILSVRAHIYSSYTVQQMRRYAFIAEPLRRVNCYSSSELLELWTAWAACAALGLWILVESAKVDSSWVGALLCYACAEYWGVVHVRTKQSRWIFPRALAFIYSGALMYTMWWPVVPSWLLLCTLSSVQLWLMLTLLLSFDCFATLPEQPPHRLLFRSLLLPAGTLSREVTQQFDANAFTALSPASVTVLREPNQGSASSSSEPRGASPPQHAASPPRRAASPPRPTSFLAGGPLLGSSRRAHATFHTLPRHGSCNATCGLSDMNDGHRLQPRARARSR